MWGYMDGCIHNNLSVCVLLLSHDYNIVLSSIFYTFTLHVDIQFPLIMHY